MKIPLQIECPYCQAQLRLNSRDSLGRKFRCRACREIFIAEEPEEGFDSVDDGRKKSNAPPKSKAALPKLPRVPRLSKRAWKRIAIGGGVAAVLVALFFVLPWKPVGQFVETINPFSDSPHAVLSSLEKLSSAYRSHVKSVKDSKPLEKDCAPLERANPGAEKLLRRAEDLYFRALRLRPISLDERKELKELHPKCWVFPETGLFVHGGEWEDELWRKAHTDGHVAWLNNIRNVARQGEAVAWLVTRIEAIPEPQDEFDRVEMAMIDQLYETIDYLTGINSAGDMESAAEELAEQSKDLQKLNERLEELRRSQGAKNRGSESAYEKFRESLDERIEKIEGILAGRYGENESLHAVVHDLKNADALIAEKTRDERWKTMKTNDPFDDWNPTNNQVMEGQLRQHGKKNVLFVGESKAIGYPDSDEYLASLKKAAGKDPDQRYNDGWGMMNVFVTDKDPNEFAKQIAGAKVVSIDAERRQITVEPLPPKPQQWEIDRERMMSPLERKFERRRKLEAAGIKPTEMLGPLERGSRIPLSSDFELPRMPADLAASWILPKSREQLIEEHRQKYGKDKVLVVLIPDTYFNHEQQMTWFDRMKSITTSSSFGRMNIDNTNRKDGTAYIADISDDIQELAAAMTFVTVRSVDVENRTITVEPLGKDWGKKATAEPAKKRPRRGDSPAPPKENPFKPD